MRSYFKADLHRIFGKTPRMIIMAITCMICAATAFLAARAGEDSILSSVPLLVNSALVTVIGLVEMGCVFGDDFKARSMQIGIGTGISRTKIVFEKILQLMTVTAVDLAAVFLCRIIGTFFGTFNLGCFAVKTEVLALAGVWIQVVVLICVVSFIMYHFQSTKIALLAFLLLNLSILEQIVPFIESALKLSNLHLEDYMIGGLLNQLTRNLGTAPVSVTTILGITAYALLGILLACVAFKHKELEF